MMESHCAHFMYFHIDPHKTAPKRLEKTKNTSMNSTPFDIYNLAVSSCIFYLVNAMDYVQK